MTREPHRSYAVERHARAVAQTGQWARAAAEAGDYVDAVAWLRMLEAMDGTLSQELQALLDDCLDALACPDQQAA